MENKCIKNIEVGKFYLIHDGSKTGHPGFVIWKNDIYNLYLFIKVGTTKNNNNEMLKESISNDKVTHYIYKRPFLGKRKDFGSKVFKDMFVSGELKSLADIISKTNPVESKSINRKDRYHFKKLFLHK